MVSYTWRRVLSTTINKYTYVTCRWLPPFFPHKHRVVYSRLEDVRSPYEIIHPSINAVLSAYNPEKGIELHTDADLPARSGLGSSSAFLVGLLHSMEALMGKRVTPMWLAKKPFALNRMSLRNMSALKIRWPLPLAGSTSYNLNGTTK